MSVALPEKKDSWRGGCCYREWQGARKEMGEVVYGAKSGGREGMMLVRVEPRKER